MYLSNSQQKKAFLTSTFHNCQDLLIAKDMSALNDVISVASQQVSSQSMSHSCENPRVTNLALYLSMDPSLCFILYSYLQEMGFTPFSDGSSSILSLLICCRLLQDFICITFRMCVDLIITSIYIFMIYLPCPC